MAEVSSDSVRYSCETAVECPHLSPCSQHSHYNLEVLISDNWMIKIKNGLFTKAEPSASV